MAEDIDPIAARARREQERRLRTRDTVTDLVSWRQETARSIGIDDAPLPEMPEWMADSVPEPEAIEAVDDYAPKPYSARSLSDIPRRRFVGNYYAYPRGNATALVGVGGGAKSLLTIAEALALASGRGLLHAPPGPPARVWLLNLEDPIDELDRRIGACMSHFGITNADIDGRLFVTSGMDSSRPFVTAETGRQGTTIFHPVYERIAEHIRVNGIDAMTVDPFVSTHRVPENDNGAIDAVTKRWARVGSDTASCIQLVHHLRKLGGREATAEDTRGGIAIVGAVRLTRVINRMTKEDAEKAGLADEVWRYFRTSDGKANITPSTDRSTWYRLESVRLPNADDEGEGDSVGVVTAWKWPDPFEDITAGDLKRVQAAITQGEWKLDKRGKGEWVGKLVGQVCGIDITDEAGKEQVSAMVRTWIERGALKTENRLDKNRNRREFVVLGDISE